MIKYSCFFSIFPSMKRSKLIYKVLTQSKDIAIRPKTLIIIPTIIIKVVHIKDYILHHNNVK